MHPSDQTDEDDLTPPLVMGNPLESLMPVLVFLGLNRFAGLTWAIAGATLWSLKAAYDRKRRGMPVGKFLPIITAGILIRGLVGILTDSEAVYFGLGIATKAGFGLVFIATALIGRNLLAGYAPLAFGFDGATVRSSQYRSAMKHISVGLGVALLLGAGFDTWLFNNASVDGYLLIRFAVNWPLITGVLVASYLYLGRRLSTVDGFPGMSVLLESRMEQYEDAVKQRRAGRSRFGRSRPS